MQDRPRDQVRKISDEQHVMHEVVFLDLALIGVHQKGDLGKGKEGNAQRQDDVSQIPVRAKQRVQAADKEIGVLVVGQQAQVGGNRKDK